MQELTVVIVIAALGVALIVLTGLLLRWWFARLLGWRLKRSSIRAEQHMTALLRIMGTRMGRPWMIEELSAVTGTAPEELRRLLVRGRQFVKRSWEEHPTTGAEYEALRLNVRGVRAYGQFAPEDMDAYAESGGDAAQATGEVMDLRTFTPLVPFGPAALQTSTGNEDFDERPDEPQAGDEDRPDLPPARRTPRGFRHTRRHAENHD